MDHRVTAIRPLAACALLALMSACASTEGGYPSLAQREAERVDGTFTPDIAEAPPPPPVAPSADLASRLADLQRQVSAIDAEFRAATPAGERLASAGGATGSDSWAAAQVALADLDSLRSRAAVALADLDTLWADAVLQEGTPREAIGAARAAVEAVIASQDQVLSRLRGRVGA